MDLFASHTVSIVGITLVHFLWQGTLIGLGTAALLAACPPTAASIRYRIAGGGLLLMVVAPLVTLATLSAPPAEAVGPGGWAGLAETTKAVADGPASTLASMAAYLPLAVAAWAAGVVLLTTRLMFAWWRTERVRRIDVQPATEGLTRAVSRLAGQLRLRRAIRLFESPWVDTPTVIGWLRPTILLPIGALTGLSVQQIEAVLSHELAHIRRHDYLVNVLQNLAETVFFFHPAVWWVSRRIRIEREHCCDDVAVRACGNPVGYARALTMLEARRQHQAAFALAATDGSLGHRIRRLLGAPPAHASRPTLSIVVCVAVLLGLLASGAVQTQTQPTVSEASASAIQVEVLQGPEGTFVEASSPGTPIETLSDGRKQSPPASPAGFVPDVMRQEAPAAPGRDQQVAPAEPVKVGGDIKEPRKVRSVPPVYPAAAQQAGVSGVVILEAVIDTDGSVSSIRVLRSIPDLDQAAINAVRQWRYTPTLLNGVPVPVMMTVTVNFTLQETPERLESRYEDLRRQMEEALEDEDVERYRSLQLERMLVEQRVAAERRAAGTEGQAPGVTRQDATRDDDSVPRTGGTVIQPRKIHDVRAIYPAAALAAGVSGVVILDATIDEQGNVTEPRILRSIPMLDNAALEAVMQWKYAPPTVGGVPTPVRVTMTVNFTLR